jgi:ribosomal protein S26
MKNKRCNHWRLESNKGKTQLKCANCGKTWLKTSSKECDIELYHAPEYVAG